MLACLLANLAVKTSSHSFHMWSGMLAEYRTGEMPSYLAQNYQTTTSQTLLFKSTRLRKKSCLVLRISPCPSLEYIYILISHFCSAVITEKMTWLNEPLNKTDTKKMSIKILQFTDYSRESTRGRRDTRTKSKQWDEGWCKTLAGSTCELISRRLCILHFICS